MLRPCFPLPAGPPRDNALRHSTGSLPSQHQAGGYAISSHPLRHSLTASVSSAGGAPGGALVAAAAAAGLASGTPLPAGSHQLRRSLGSSAQEQSSFGRSGGSPDAPAGSAVGPSQLTAGDSYAGVDSASMAVHPMISPHPSILAASPAVSGVPPLPLAGVMMQNSPLDPHARLFYNPAFSAEGLPGRMSESKSMTRWVASGGAACSCSCRCCCCRAPPHGPTHAPATPSAPTLQCRSHPRSPHAGQQSEHAGQELRRCR